MNDENIEKLVVSMVEEAMDLRHGEAGDEDGKLRVVSFDEGVRAVAYELQRVRVRSDRVDYLRDKTALIRSTLRKRKAETDFEAEAKFSQAISDRDSIKKEYASALSVKSKATLDSFDELRAAHESKKLIDLVNECYEIIDRCGRQLDGIRNDLRVQLRTLQFESTLDH